jgi:sarcosine oxidase, subunit gamma
MAESTVTLPRTHPLEAWAAAFAELPDAFAVTVEPYVAMVDVRLAAAEARGIDLPSVPNTWVPTEHGRAIWLGPDEWLLTSDRERPEELEARARAAVVPLGGAAADVSAQRIAIRLTGPRVRAVLAKGCAIDLHPRVFGRGRCAQTTLGLAGVVLLALGAAGGDFLVLVRSSFAGYLAEWLLDAALEFSGGFTAAPVR